ncbi:Tp53-Target 3 Protein [Manis pentadactyla]|nr:Tp53-Target 3 Protein [Manis pentadactyla]
MSTQVMGGVPRIPVPGKGTHMFTCNFRRLRSAHSDGITADGSLALPAFQSKSIWPIGREQQRWRRPLAAWFRVSPKMPVPGNHWSSPRPQSWSHIF